MKGEQTPPWPPVGGPLDDVNADFHDSYAQARSSVATSDPVLVLIDHELIVAWKGTQERVSVTPRVFHVLKSIAHGPIAIYAAMRGEAGDAQLSRQAQQNVTRLLHRHELARRTAAADLANLPTPTDADALAVLDGAIAFLRAALAQRSVSQQALKAFAEAMGPPLLGLTDQATQAQLHALHEAVQAALAKLPSSEHAKLQVVVVGDHQARERSLAMQYFRKRLRDPEGVEDRVTFGEGISDLEEALALVGTRRLDRDIATDFFGDAKRLQRDVLGDSAQARLQALELPPI